MQTITQSGTTLTYAYDDAGNITSVSDGTKAISYEYDLLGQLTRVNDPYDTTAGTSGTTWKYAYDQGGNIQSKTAHVFTTGTVGSAVKTDSFTYGDANWKDKLTAFNGTTITYDEIGNPTNDGTWNYTWIGGRQMRAMYKGEFGEQGYDEITFEYNENGLRTKKTRMYFDDATGDIGYKATNYTLHGKNIVHMSDGSNNLHFFYDAQNKPAVVIFNGTAYAYLYNLQGDVIGLVDSNGTKMVSYTYDAWGKMLSKTGTLASTLGTIQPFRYRGYVFDEETGLYYLRNRYYCYQFTRFVNADRYMAAVGSAIKGNNLFTYCSNDPVNQVDSDGIWPKWLTGALNTICGTLEVAAGLALGATVGWTGIGAVAATALVIDGSATASQGIGQIINDVTDTHYMREDNVAKTGVQAIGQIVAGDNGAAVAGVVYDASIFAASMYVPAKATQRALQQAGKLPVRVPVSNIRNNPLDEFVTVGPKPGQVSEYCRTLTRSNYGPIYVTELGNGLYQLADGHHRVQAIRSIGWKYINVWITK